MPLAAKGLLMVILTNKKDWRVYPEEIAKRIGLSKKTVETYFKTLEQLGYMKSERTGGGRGKGIEVERYFSDRKIFLKT